MSSVEAAACRVDAIADVGANVGHSTEVLLSHFPSASAVLFEPNPLLVPRLLERFSEMAHVEIIPKAMDSRAGVVDFFDTYDDNADYTNGAIARVDSHSMFRMAAVEATTLDALFSNSANPLVLKVDTEGNDLEVLRGAGGLLRSGRVVAVQAEYNSDKWCRGEVEKHSSKTQRECLAREAAFSHQGLLHKIRILLYEAGYDAYLIGPEYLSLQNTTPMLLKVLSRVPGTGDVFAVRRDHRCTGAVVEGLKARRRVT